MTSVPSSAGLQPLPEPLISGQAVSALAPMQDVTDLPFMRLLGQYGVPDYYFTEFFRVHSQSTLERHILESVTDHGTGRPVFAQLIGEELDHMERAARELQRYPIAGVDLNMGCPAPKIYKKCVGGGLLRDVPKVDALLGRLRESCEGRFSVKMRLGFEEPDNFDAILDLIEKHRVDLLSIHGRTVKQMYRGEVDYDWIRHARGRVPCPVLANGNVTSAERARKVLEHTGCFGVMIGRSAIRNPWIFRQFRELQSGQVPFAPLLKDVRTYVDDLWQALARPGLEDRFRLSRMKKFLNFVGQGVDPEGVFLREMRRATEVQDFFEICDRHLIAADRGHQAFTAEPFPGVEARPNRGD